MGQTDQHFTITIGKPVSFADPVKKEMIALIAEGGQIKYDLAKVGVHRSKLIGTLSIAGELVATCCLKNPLESYVSRVFRESQTALKAEDFQLELGYITTKKGFEGNKYCQQLLAGFMPHIGLTPLFATTRKPEMIHILQKNGFHPTGELYHTDLSLMTFFPA